MRIYKIANFNKEAGLIDDSLKKAIQWIQSKYPSELQKAQQIAQQSGGDAQKLANLLGIQDQETQEILNSALQEAKGIRTASNDNLVRINKTAGVAGGIMAIIKKYWKSIGVVAVLAILCVVFGSIIAEVLSSGLDVAGQMGMGEILDIDNLNMVGDAFHNHNSVLGDFTLFQDQAGNYFAQNLEAEVFQLVEGKWVYPNFETIKPSLDLQHFDMTEINNMKDQIRQQLR